MRPSLGDQKRNAQSGCSSTQLIGRELCDDKTTPTNDRRSSVAELFPADDPFLHRVRGGLRPVLQQVARTSGAGRHSQVSTAPGTREESRLVHSAGAHRRAQIPLRANAETRVVRPRGCQAQGPAKTPDGHEPRRGDGSAGCHAESEASRIAGDPLRNWITLRRSAPAQDYRYRQPTHGDSSAGRERPAVPSSHALAQAADTPARLLALAEAPGLVVSRGETRLSHASLRRPADLPTTGQEGRHQKTGEP